MSVTSPLIGKTMGALLATKPEYADLIDQVLEMHAGILAEVAKLSPEQQAQFVALREKMDKFGDGDILDA